jgi:hypothetical protein
MNLVMERSPQPSCKSEIVVNSDRISSTFMALLLLFALFFAIADVRAIIDGHVPQVTHKTVILAVYTGYLAAVSRFERLFRIGAAALSISAAVRAIAHYSQLSSDVQREAGINGLVLSLFACIVIFVATVQWFRQIVRIERGS